MPFSNLHHASPRRGQDGCTDDGSKGHLGGRGAADRDGVALVRGAAVHSGLVADSQKRTIRGGVAAGWLPAALRVEAHRGEACESCGEKEEIEEKKRKTIHL